MKLVKYTFAAAAVLALASCGVSNRHDEVKKLADDTEEWSADQTNEAIDIYIEGLNEQAKLVEDVFLIEEKIDLEDQWEYKAKKASYWKDRKDEIKEAKKKFKDAQKELRLKYKDDDE